MKKDKEFFAKLEDHPIPNGNIYRLHFVDYYRIGEGYGMRKNNIGMTDWTFDNFMLPDNMNREDAFKILSYLSDYIEADLRLKPCSYASVRMLNEVLNIPRLGFKKVAKSSTEEPIDLFTIKGRLLLFKQSPYYEKYFEWYTEGITFDEIKSIYQKYGIEFYDLIARQKENNVKKLQRTKED